MNKRVVRGTDGYAAGIEVKVLGITVYENTTLYY
ncbi:hypothetical protein DFR58_103196 [Anaerobacterium chartisolvens]|uniref:Uncharacterized protein n=1 Tax=Anaerobacterium chartisolvens TaxID=1297424 RepID=A0A369BD19_9FIRM|nr:hypothetical protein DFR58_103196 [Anaerobacterium chartisolvens]